MSQEELYELHKKVQELELLVREQLEKSQAWEPQVDGEQIKFIVSLAPNPAKVVA